MERKKKSKRYTTNITRSRGGCLSCKRLRIKCDQAKPKCEYCAHTNRECSYAVNLVTVEFQQSRLSNQQQIVALNQRYYYDILHQLNLNTTTSQLGISKFELRLLHFFNNHCIQEITEGVNDAIRGVWTDKVPALFLKSELIRNSIFSYASLNLNPLCNDLNQLNRPNDSDRKFKFNELVTFTNEDMSVVPDSQELYVNTTNYFTKTLAGQNQLLGRLSSLNNNLQHVVVLSATELIVSGVLILSFLAIHSHRLLPLVSFDQSETDYISMCKGTRQAMRLFDTTISHRTFRDMFQFEKEISTPNAKESKFPIIIGFLRDLMFDYESSGLSSNSEVEYNTLYDTLESLQSCLFKAVTYRYSVPLFRWILILSDPCHELIYKQNFFALRLLFIFSCLTLLMKFQTFKDTNTWIDYLKWYRGHNFQLYNDWKYNMDKSLYYLATKKDFKYDDDNHSHLVELDPELLEQVI